MTGRALLEEKLEPHVKHLPTMTVQEAIEKDQCAISHPTPEPYDKNIVWSSFSRIAMIHLMALYGITLIPQLKWQTHIFNFIYALLSGLSVTCGAHRLWCHRAYKAKLPFRIFLMLTNCIATQNDLYVWVRDHRVHHKYSETDADPHNINRGFFFAHVGWLFVKKHPEVLRKGAKIDCSDVLADPVVRFQRNNYVLLTILFSFFVPTALPVYLWGESAWNAWFVSAIFRLVLSLNITWSVNSWAHYWGSKPYDKHIAPTESPWVSIWAVGEGFHNFHHTFPHDYRCSELGWKLNPSKVLIDLMAKIGWAYDLKTVHDETIERKKWSAGDGSRRNNKILTNGTTPHAKSG